MQNSEIANLDQWVFETRDLQSVQRNRKNLGVRGFAPFSSNELNAGLIKLPGPAFAGRLVSERGADITKSRFTFWREVRLVLGCLQVAQICPAGRYCQFRPETDFTPSGIGKNVHASANV